MASWESDRSPGDRACNHLCVAGQGAAVSLPSDHLSLAKSAAASMPGRALELREKEFGEPAQASERSRLDGPKRKVQVCGYL